MGKDEKLLTTRDAAILLDCMPDEVIVLARTGKIRATKEGKFWKFLLKMGLKIYLNLILC